MIFYANRIFKKKKKGKNMVRETGQVKWFNEKKGYGFIINELGEDIFVHYNNIINCEGFKTLEPNEKVTFEREEGPKGIKAQNVIKMAKEKLERAEEKEI